MNNAEIIQGLDSAICLLVRERMDLSGEDSIKLRTKHFKLSFEKIEKETRQRCKVLRTDLSEIEAGAIGTILKEENDGEGYEVEFTKIFKRAGQSTADANTSTTKSFYFKKSEVEILPNDAEPVREGSGNA